MISVNLSTPTEIQKSIGQRVRALRLALNWTQRSLAEKSGMSYSSLKKFEQTGQISLVSLLKLALVLGCMDDFELLFNHSDPKKTLSLDELIQHEERKRGRQ